MMVTANSNSIGKIIFDFLTRKADSVFDAQSYGNIVEASTQIVGTIINRQNLNSVVTPFQKEKTVDQLVLEIIEKPEDLENDENCDKSSITTSAQIRYIAETSKVPELAIYSYLLKRSLTLLKSFAEGSSKEYLELLQKIKSTIRAKNISTSKRQGTNCIAYSANSNICYIPDFHKLTIPEMPCDKELKIGPILENILKANEEYYFRQKDLMAIIAELMMKDKSALSYEDEAVQKTLSNKSALKTDGFNKNIAIETMNNLIKCQSENETLVNQSEMALLAYFCKVVSGYFSEEILTEEQKRLPLTDCIEKFLNDKRFINLLKRGRIERTTAHTRLKNAQTSLQNIMNDLSAEERSFFVKEYCKHLEKRFIELTGGDKNE